MRVRPIGTGSGNRFIARGRRTAGLRPLGRRAPDPRCAEGLSAGLLPARGLFGPESALVALLALAFASTPVSAQEPEASSMFRFEVELGAGGPREQRLAGVGDFDVSTDGRVYVIDPGDRSIKVFDAGGRYVRAFDWFDGEGDGLASPSAIRLLRDTVLVLDRVQHRVSRFTLDGELISTSPLVPPANTVIAHPARLRDGRMLAQTIYRATIDAYARDPSIHVVLFRDGTARLDTLTSMAASSIVWQIPDRPSQWSGEPSPFGQGGAWAVSGDSLLAVLDGYTGEVVFTRIEADGLRRTRTMRTSARGRPIAERDIAQLRREIEARKAIMLPRNAVFFTPPQWSIATGEAFFAGDGSLWLERNNLSETRAVWSRIDPRAGTLRNFAFPIQFTLRRVQGDRHYGIWTETDGTQAIRIYRSIGSAKLTGP